MLRTYNGINPVENARSAAKSVWYSVCELASARPASWSEAVAWFDHPKVQAEIAYWKAMGPWLVKQGLDPVPVEEPAPAAATPVPAKVEAPPLLLPASKPTPGAPLTSHHLPRGSFEHGQSLVLSDPLRSDVVRLAITCTKNARSEQPLRKLDDTLLAVAKWVAGQNIKEAEVFVRGLQAYSRPATIIVKRWMDVVRLHQDAKNLRLFFRFDQ